MKIKQLLAMQIKMDITPSAVQKCILFGQTNFLLSPTIEMCYSLTTLTSLHNKINVQSDGFKIFLSFSRNTKSI